MSSSCDCPVAPLTGWLRHVCRLLLMALVDFYCYFLALQRRNDNYGSSRLTRLCRALQLLSVL